MDPIKALTPDELYRRCDPGDFEFATTADLEPLTEMVGQQRAVDAVDFGISMDQQGFNLFVLGPPGTGRHSFVRRYLAQRAAGKAVPSDWCYVNNFDEPRKPLALELPAGRAREFRQELSRLVDDAYTVIPAAFEAEDYRRRKQAIEEGFGRSQAERFEEISERAKARGIALVRVPTGFAFAPMRDGKALAPEEFETLPPEEKARLESETRQLGEEVQQAMKAMPRLAREMRQRVNDLDREVSTIAAGSLVDDLVEQYAEIPKVVEYLRRLQADIIENVSLFLDGSSEGQTPAPPAQQPGLSSSLQPKEPPAKRRYTANVLVDHGSLDGAPIVFEDHPSYQNLVGETEYQAQMGALVTDFGLIRGGALHQANGGYLVLDAHKVLSEPFAWQALKQALECREIRIEPIGQAYSVIRTATLEPEPIPLRLKVILIGERWLYYLLLALDPDFSELFKVAADFDDRMERSTANNRLFARLLGTLARQEGLKAVDRGGVARLIEESSRHAEHSGKLSAQVRRAADIMREANHWAGLRGAEVVQVEDVEAAIERKTRRESRLQERIRDEIVERTVLIDTEGERIGQVNGLAVIQTGDSSFGRPNRITARVALGAGRVVDIEREAALGGPIHSKGVLILSGFLAAHYVADRPLSLTASLVFEQSYGGVEGDSASSAELYALLSALAELPVRQCFAVTGSVNQQGEVQAIGGVNEKIEGFFDVCRARGLDGNQGVLIPAANVRHLMLRHDVIEAVRAGQFQIFPVTTIDQGMEILTGHPAGTRDDLGAYPEGTINHRIRARLVEFADKRRAFGADRVPEVLSPVAPPSSQR